jgi:hypothetical protein
VQARIGGNHPPETTSQWVAAKFEHDSARPVAGYSASQLHTHTVVFNLITMTNHWFIVWAERTEGFELWQSA